MSYRDVATRLKRAGFVCARTSKHDVYVHKAKNVTVPLPRHSGDIPKGMLRAIIKEAGFSVDYFLSL